MITDDLFNGDTRIIALRQSILRGAEQGSLCLSGGAKGADLLWGKAAIDAGMQAVHWSFDGHKKAMMDATYGRFCRLSPSTMELAAPTMEAVSRRLGRRLSIQPHIRSLLLRNLFQVVWSDCVYAVSSLDANGLVNGGTAWAVEAFRMKKTGSAYLFCQDRKQWHASTGGGEWANIGDDQVPVPQQVWGGIGTREPTLDGRAAIERIAERMKPALPALR